MNCWLERAVDGPGAVSDRFYRDLSFGAGGLRGVVGAGSNRMNLHTVRGATQGLADYLSAAIAYDSRIKEELSAREAARVLAANGITARLSCNPSAPPKWWKNSRASV